MSPTGILLAAVRRRIRRQQGVLWATRAAAGMAFGTLLVAVAARRWPAFPMVPVLSAVVMFAAIGGFAGWLRARPSTASVAAMADRALGGHERLATAVDLDGDERPVARWQRAEADRWAVRADPEEAAPNRWPRAEGLFTVVPLAAALLLTVLPNPSAESRERRLADRAARERVADQVEELAAEQEASGPGATPKAALAAELRRAADAVRKAPDATRAVAALSRAQRTLPPVTDRQESQHRAQATSAAGARLAANPAAAAAGAALAAAAGGGGALAGDLAASLSAMSGEQRGALAAELDSEAAASAPGDAADLAKAAEALRADDPEEAAAALAEAQPPPQAAKELAELADSVAGLDAERQAELAEALRQAAAGEGSEVVEQLRAAGERLAQGDVAAATAALKEAGRLQDREEADRRDAADAARADADLQDLKDALLATSEEAARPDSEPCRVHVHPGRGHPGGDPFPGPLLSPASPARVAAPACGQSPGSKGAEAEGAQPSASGADAPVQGPSGGAGQAPGEGQGAGQAQGASGGAGAGDSDSPGPGGGKGQGRGGGEQGHRGGGATGGGAEGRLSGAPGRPSEQISVPGPLRPGRAQDLAPGSGTGAQAALVPYERVYAEYRAAALRQVDRDAVPEPVRDLLLRYFSEAGS